MYGHVCVAAHTLSRTYAQGLSSILWCRPSFCGRRCGSRSRQSFTTHGAAATPHHTMHDTARRCTARHEGTRTCGTLPRRRCRARHRRTHLYTSRFPCPDTRRGMVSKAWQAQGMSRPLVSKAWRAQGMSRSLISKTFQAQGMSKPLVSKHMSMHSLYDRFCKCLYTSMRQRYCPNASGAPNTEFNFIPSPEQAAWTYTVHSLGCVE